MILFVFEGDEREPNLFRTLERIYFPRDNNNIVCSFGNNIYELYNEMMELDGDGDIVSVLKERLSSNGNNRLDGYKSSDFAEIFLFFDYDFQNTQLSLEEVNRRVNDMLQLFCDETGNGKLYINYPMIESIRYVKELPDDNYWTYSVTREQCKRYKQIAKEFSFYDSFDFILFKDGEKPTKDKFLKISDNWNYLKQMNVSKANFIISGNNEMPKDKADVNQLDLFTAQKGKYVDANESVAVLNSFPLFIYEYMR